MRLIDADALMKELAEFVAPSNRSDFVQPPNWNDAVSLVGSAPTIEPKKGKWYAIGNSGLASCECGYITDRYSIYNFCPNCGARMTE